MISVIMPAKILDEQGLAWFQEALQSVEDQPKSVEREVILINDHSTMDVAALAKQFSARYIVLEKTGLAAARNAGVSQSKGEFFFGLDADDRLAENALKIVLDKYPGDGFLFGSTMLFNADSQLLYKARSYNFEELMKHVYWPNGCLQKKENWVRLGGWDEKLKILEDWDYWLRAGEMGICGHDCPDLLYWYRQNPNGMIARMRSNRSLWKQVHSAVVQRHKSIYEGDYPTMCCGHRSDGRQKTPKTAGAVLPPLPGKNGLIVIEYAAHNVGRQTFYGPITGARYQFGGAERYRQGYVDVQDAYTRDASKPGLLELQEHGEFLFKEVTV